MTRSPYIAVEQTNDGGLYVHGQGAFGHVQVRFNPDGSLRESLCEISDQVAPCFGCPDQVPPFVPAVPASRSRWGPGDVVAYAVMILTLGMVRPCKSCQSRRNKLNKLGWTGLIPSLWRRIAR